MAVGPKRTIKVFRGQKASGWESSASPLKTAKATVVRLPAPSRTRMALCGTLRRAQTIRRGGLQHQLRELRYVRQLWKLRQLQQLLRRTSYQRSTASNLAKSRPSELDSSKPVKPPRSSGLVHLEVAVECQGSMPPSRRSETPMTLFPESPSPHSHERPPRWSQRHRSDFGTCWRTPPLRRHRDSGAKNAL